MGAPFVFLGVAGQASKAMFGRGYTSSFPAGCLYNSTEWGLRRKTAPMLA